MHVVAQWSNAIFKIFIDSDLGSYTDATLQVPYQVVQFMKSVINVNYDKMTMILSFLFISI